MTTHTRHRPGEDVVPLGGQAVVSGSVSGRVVVKGSDEQTALTQQPKPSFFFIDNSV